MVSLFAQYLAILAYYKWSEWPSFRKTTKKLWSLHLTIEYWFYRPTWLGALLYYLQAFDLCGGCTLGTYAFKSAV